MNVTIPDVMRHVRNHFVTSRLRGSWQIAGGALLPADPFTPGAWVAILDGPVSGVWQLDESGALPGAADAAWEGCICLLEPPAGFLRLCREIADWAAQRGDSTIISERFGEYSRSLSNTDWTQVFAAALAHYRRMYPEVTV